MSHVLVDCSHSEIDEICLFVQLLVNGPNRRNCVRELQSRENHEGNGN